MFVHLLSTVLLGPILFFQGRRVRRNIPILPEPPGERSGVIGSGPPLKVLLLGDSAAAGVGANHQRDALSGHLATALSADFSLSWTLMAETGATTASTLQSLNTQPDQKFDLVLISLGVNDVTKGAGLKSWLNRQRKLRSVLVQRFGARGIISTGIPPMDKFPALPHPLRWYLGRRATQFDQALEKDLASDDECHYLSMRFSEDLSLMAEDGFHPGPALYKEWAERVAALIRSSNCCEEIKDV